MAATPIALGTRLPAAGLTSGTLPSACHSSNPGIACRLIWDLSHSAHAAEFTSVYLAGPIRLTLRILFVLALAVVLRFIARRLIKRLTARTAISQDRPDRLYAVFGERRSQRAKALATVLGNAASLTIFGIAALIILGDLGLNLAPVLASAGVLGIAIGFGAQSLVQDFLAGVFILLEDQYGVGDVIDVSAVTGTVEAVSLRITRLRDVDGVVWHIRNGTIKQAGNETHGWARAVVDFPVPYGLSVAAARNVLERTAADMAQDPRWQASILEPPEVWGVETVSPEVVVVRVTARTAPLAKHAVARELRERLKHALDTEMASPGTLAAGVPRQGGAADAGRAATGPAAVPATDGADDSAAAWRGAPPPPDTLAAGARLAVDDQATDSGD